MQNTIVKHSKKLIKILAVVIIFIIGCGGAVVDKTTLEPEKETLISKKTLVRQHRAFDHFSKGSLYEVSGNLEKAADEYRLALSYDSDSDELKRSLANIYYNLSRCNEALELIVDIKQPIKEDFNIAAECFNTTGSDDKAIEYFKKAVRQDSMFELPNRIMASYYEEKGDFKKAEKYYKRLVKISKFSDAWLLELASFYIKTDKEKKAIKIYEKMIAEDSLDNRGYLGIASIMEMRDEIHTADSLYKFIAYKNWDDAAILNIIAQSFIRLDDFEMAAEITRRIIELYPDDYYTQRRYALLLFSHGDEQMADSVLAELSFAVDDDPILYYYRGRIAQSNEEFSRAESMYVKSISIADTLTEAWVSLAHVRSDSADFDAAFATLDTALMRCPADSLQLFYYKGVFLAGEDRFTEAAEYYQRILSVQPENVNIMFNLGAAYERSGQHEKAEDIFKAILEITPDNAMTLNYLGYMYADRGVNLDQAEKMIKKALAAIPDNGAYLDSYAWVMYKKGKYKKALKYQLKAMEADIDDPILFEHMGDIYEALSKPALAKEFWNKAFELDPDNETIKEKLAK
ncbi:MAG: tetratricopeptide repeat protein [candidate division Zixibacteria bacterium]|nr:tetratricopeptide repeat protein [candidate division Zixibacteria bacterium]